MIPILYSKQETTFNHNGLGLVADCLQASVTEERNGLFELVFTYPVNGPLFSYLVNDSIVKAKPNDNSNDQLFSIYSISKVENGIVTIAAKHISYDLNANPLKSNLAYDKVTPATAITNILKNTVHPNSFSAWSDINTTGKIDYKIPLYAKETLGGIEGSVLDVFKGEFEFDNKTIKLWKNRGADNGVKIAYGKNLTTATQEEAIDDTFTSIYPYKTLTNNAGEPELLSLPESIINSDYVSNYRTGRTMMVDFTSDDAVTDVPTLRNAAVNYVENNDIGIPKISLKISFINLWQTETYKDIAVLEKVSLCDTVEIHFERIGINTKAKVIKTIYDVLNEKYLEMELGEAKSNLADQINQQANEMKDAQLSNAWLAEAVANATEIINNAPANARIVIYPSLANPQEILILVDGTTVETVTKLWRWNAGGLGYSKNGYSGPYELAMTSDGAIVADMMTTGTLRAINIIGVNITGSKVQADLFSAQFLPTDSTPLRYTLDLTGSGLIFKAINRNNSSNFVEIQLGGEGLEYRLFVNGEVRSERSTSINDYGIDTPSIANTGNIYIRSEGEARVVDDSNYKIPGKTGDPDEYEYRNIRAKGFIQHSTVERKQDFVKYEDTEKLKATDIIKSAGVFEYRLKDDISINDYDKKIGMLAEMLPPHLKNDGKSIDLYALVASLWQYARENEEEKQQMRNELEELKEIVYCLSFKNKEVN
ncbi:phage tail spike protein [Listeria seeligeri]|uniref:phage tail spike protein n=1 Tax=Listeria seeligeri TaxID=1640 RepID=UPI0022EBC3B3|nr:phage tail spike protein [Listeria seeligeri]